MAEFERRGTEEERASLRVSKAIFSVQSQLLELPRCTEEQLLSAGSLLSLPDYDDVVTERSISGICGSPLCPKLLPPASRWHRGHYRISLREHRVYDLRDLDRFCSDSCHVSSKAFSSTLPPDRSANLSASRIAGILRLFDGKGEEIGDLGLCKLTLHERTAPTAAEDPLRGPSNAIEGYVPLRDRQQQGSKSRSNRERVGFAVEFNSDVIVDNELSEIIGKMKLNKAGEDNVKVKELKQRSVRWADEVQVKVLDGRDVDERPKETVPMTSNLYDDDDDDNDGGLHLASGAAAPLPAEEAMPFAEGEVVDAANEAGIAILTPAHDDEVDSDTDDEALAFEGSYQKWPRKPVLLDTDMFVVEDSLHDSAPEGFNLTMSTFGTMWNALFGWITCSSVAYIYGKSEDYEDDFLFVNGREYPRKISLSDGRSAEIKRALAGYIARALPHVVSNLSLPIPISTIENVLGQLLETMTFIEALPPFKTKEWDVIVLLFLDALSVSRIPTLSVHMANKKFLLHKVIDAARIGRDEYETMKDLMTPLSRLC